VLGYYKLADASTTGAWVGQAERLRRIGATEMT